LGPAVDEVGIINPNEQRTERVATAIVRVVFKMALFTRGNLQQSTLEFSLSLNSLRDREPISLFPAPLFLTAANEPENLIIV